MANWQPTGRGSFSTASGTTASGITRLYVKPLDGLKRGFYWERCVGSKVKAYGTAKTLKQAKLDAAG